MCARGGGPNLNQGRKLPTKRNRSPSPSVDAVLGGDASAPAAVYNSGWARVNALKVPETCVQCTWSFFKPCNFMLPPPVTCNICSAPVHHLCQIIWENKHSYEPPGCAKYCPLHHAHYQEIVTAGGGKRSSDKSSASLSMISSAAATAAARAAQQFYITTTTPAP